MSVDVQQAVLLTVWTSILGTVWAFPIAIGAGWLLARKSFPGRTVLSALLLAPMVLPPVAIGIFLLAFLGAQGPFGDIGIVLTWRGVVVAGGLMAFPLMARSCRAAFEGVDRRLEAVSRTLGLGPWQVFWQVTLPLARRGLLAGLVLGFARCLGEYGATITLAGNIPGRTQTLSGAMMAAFDAGRDTDLRWLLAGTLLLGVGATALAEMLVEGEFSVKARSEGANQ